MRGVINGIMSVVLTTAGIATGAAAAEIGRPDEVEVVQVQEKVEKLYTPKVVTVTELVEVDPEPAVSLTFEEKQLIARVIQAEAGGEDMVGKRLVADTVINRVRDPHFPATVQAVVWQPCQYCVSGWYSDECMEAVEIECQNGQIDEWIVWFAAGSYLPYGVPAYQHGGHCFSWLPNEWIEEAEHGEKETL